MSDYQRPPSQSDEERLPWLEPVDDYDDGEAIPMTRLIGAVVVGLVALGLVIGGIFWFRNRDNGGGNGALIEAPAGPIKDRPKDAGGLDVEGAGDVAYGASVGEEINSVIDATALPEEPVIDQRTVVLPPAQPKVQPQPKAEAPKPAAPVAKPAPAAPKPAPAKPVAPKATVTVPIASAGGSGGTVQLGAFSSAALANKAWGDLVRRFPALSGASQQLSPVTVDGKTLYRLRAKVSGSAATVCARLKAAGEASSTL
jgi:cell division septation protein DedD